MNLCNPVIRVSRFCISNLKYFYIKAELDAHLAIMVRKWIVIIKAVGEC